MLTAICFSKFSYANAQTPKKGYVVIYEAIGDNPDRIITALNFWRWEPTANGGTGGYLDVTWRLTKNAATGYYDWLNARD